MFINKTSRRMIRGRLVSVDAWSFHVIADGVSYVLPRSDWSIMLGVR